MSTCAGNGLNGRAAELCLAGSLLGHSRLICACCTLLMHHMTRMGRMKAGIGLGRWSCMHDRHAVHIKRLGGPSW